MLLRQITILEAVLISIIGLVLAAILYPVLAQNNRPYLAIVYGINSIPLPHTVLRFHDPHQLSDIEITTNQSGFFSRPDFGRIAYPSTNGYAVARFIGNSKGTGTYIFSPRGTQCFTILNRSGHPVRNLSLLLSPDLRTYKPPHLAYLNRTTDDNGTIPLKQIPMVVRYLIQSNDKHWRVEAIAPPQGEPDSRFAYVPVTVTPTE